MTDLTRNDNLSGVISDNVAGYYVPEKDTSKGLLMLIPANLPQNNIIRMPRGNIVSNFYGHNSNAAYAGPRPAISNFGDAFCSVDIAYSVPDCGLYDAPQDQ